MTGLPREFALPEDAFERQRARLAAYVEGTPRAAVRRRQRIPVLVAAVVVVFVGAASAFGIVRDVFFVEPDASGRQSRIVEGVRFSFSVPRTGWQNGPLERVGRTKSRPLFRTHSLLISKSLIGGQAAEAVVFWTGFRDATEAAPCDGLFGSAAGQSTAAIAAAVARAPGTKLVTGPTHVTVGGRPAQHVVLRVRRDRGCDPGYFFTWRAQCWGACWGQTDATDTIKVWIVDVGGTRLFFEAVTKERHPVTKEPVYDLKKVEQEIAKIVRSIRFHS
jgi:hypothetical protein